MKIGLPAYEDLNQLKLFINNNCKEIFNNFNFTTELESNMEIDILILNKPINFVEKWILNTKKNGYIILNSDISILKTNYFVEGRKIISTGLNQKSTVTISSVENENVQICIQRKIENIKNKIVCQQEFFFQTHDLNINHALIFVSLLIILDKIENISLEV